MIRDGRGALRDGIVFRRRLARKADQFPVCLCEQGTVLHVQIRMAVGDDDVRESLAAIKGIRIKPGKTVREDDLFQAAAAGKDTLAHALQSLREVHFLQIKAVGEGGISDASDTGGDRNGFEQVLRKRQRADFRDAVGNENVMNLRVGKRKAANRGDRIRQFNDSDGTAFKCVRSDARDGVAVQVSRDHEALLCRIIIPDVPHDRCLTVGLHRVAIITGPFNHIQLRRPLRHPMECALLLLPKPCRCDRQGVTLDDKAGIAVQHAALHFIGVYAAVDVGAVF